MCISENVGVIMVFSLLVMIAACGGLSGCGSSGGGGGDSKSGRPPEAAPSQALTPAPTRDSSGAQPFAEIIGQGVTRYLGDFTPMLSVTDGPSITHTFGSGDGPACFDGSAYSVITRDNGSQDLLIFLMGGGACWSDKCATTKTAILKTPERGLLDPVSPRNPLRTWNVVFLPYCDGSFFAGDIDLDVDDDGIIDRRQRGLINLSAGLDIAKSTFSAPRRIVLAGTSAGGYGTTFALPLVRQLYSDTSIYVVNDSGIGVFPPETIKKILSEWNALNFIPASCANCIDENGNLSNYHAWQLSEDKKMYLGMMSYSHDAMLTDHFFPMNGDQFSRELKMEMAKLESDYPARVRSFIAAGSAHAFHLGDLQVSAGAVTVADWIYSMVNDYDDWNSVIE